MIKKAKGLFKKLFIFIAIGTVIIMILTLVIGMVFVITVLEAVNNDNQSDYSNVWSDDVIKYETTIEEYCANYDIGDYKYHIMAIMQISTNGEGKDPMAASDIVGYEIKSTDTSIEEGIKEFAALLELIGVNSVFDTDKLLTVYQTYHLGRDYYDYLNGSSHTQKIASKYIYSNDISGKTSYFADNVSKLIERAETARKNAAAGIKGNDLVYIWPLDPDYTTITSNYGSRYCPFHGKEFHSGIDISAPTGVNIYAVKSGTVIKAEYHNSYGYYMIVDHGNNIFTQYNHCSSLNVAVGDPVYQGQIIGYVGSTGDSTGAHLDFRVITSSGYDNPLEYVNATTNIKNMSGKSVQAGIAAGLSTEEIVWNYMKDSGFTNTQTAAMMGNIWAESTFDTSMIEYGNGIGFGLCQWSYSRRTDYENYAASKGKAASDLETQLEFMVATLVESQFLPTTYYSQWKTGDLATATTAICKGWERPGISRLPERKRMAQYYYDLYAN